MRRLRFLRTLVAAGLLMTPAVLACARPVAAECSFIPPLPRVSMAIPSARVLYVGVVKGTGDRATFSVRVTETFRGPQAVGDSIRYAGLQPNWPWSNDPGGQPFPSCSTIYASTGDIVIVALGARWPGGIVHENGMTWRQPATTYNTMGIVNGDSREQYGSGGRQLFSLERLHEMANAGPPATDTASSAPDSVTPSSPAPVVLSAAAGLGFALGVRAKRPSRRRFAQRCRT